MTHELRRATLVYDPGARWSTTNRKLGQHWAVRSEESAELRRYAALKARERGRVLPRLAAAHVVVRHEYAAGMLPDTDAPSLAVKALLDGLVDARVLPGDTGEHVLSITYLPAQLSDRFALTLELIEDDPLFLRGGDLPVGRLRAARRALAFLADEWLDEMEEAMGGV